MNPIIILQTASGGRDMCRMFLEDELNLVEGKDFIVFEDIYGVPEAIASEGRQLFVTGSFFGFSSTHDVLEQFVQMLRDKNPDLVCLSFAADSLSGPFDGTMSKDGNVRESLQNGFGGFMEGRINRTAARSNVVPFSTERYEATVGRMLDRTKPIQAIDKIFERRRKSA